jgi:AcrR family transcriptional regulator
MTSTSSTRDRILDGALKAIATHGLADLAMRDVGAASGVARGTVYRHFANREALLAELARREGVRFMERWRTHLAGVPAGAERLRAAMEYPLGFAARHPVLARLVESDPDYVLRAIREHYAAIRTTLEQLVGPVLGEMSMVKDGVLPPGQAVDWFVRVMLSTFLIPPEDPGALGRNASAMHAALKGREHAAA